MPSATALSAKKGLLEIITYFGIPEKIRADRNPFTADIVKNVAHDYCFELELNLAYQPEWYKGGKFRLGELPIRCIIWTEMQNVNQNQRITILPVIWNRSKDSDSRQRNYFDRTEYNITPNRIGIG
ncbi:hypothetical protein AYI69_g4391 [Smittium culicis]|uniref:Uncharacterized protein n=1 Tax=Smittium culicis TaxID=133412 RepID=A0A1R1YEA4_9FUNG|nr:hypothetical protein AYI69_g4391 [Smittium culicis]